VSEVLAALNFEELWDVASVVDRRILIEDLVDSVNIFPDHLTVRNDGASPTLVSLQEVGLNQS
jgi:hypothetical protein